MRGFVNAGDHVAWCPRFASFIWTLTWAEEDSGRLTEYFQLTISGMNAICTPSVYRVQ